MARVCLGEAGDAAKRWVLTCQEELMRDPVAEVSRAILARPPPTEEAEAVRAETRR